MPSRYVIKNYPHPTLYGGKGRKEAFIRADGTDYILEAKWQQSPGSVDEKIPYIWESFLESEVKNWFVVMDGRYWRDGRGKAVFAWLNQKAAATGGQRQMVVTDRRGFIEWAKCRWI